MEASSSSSTAVAGVCSATGVTQTQPPRQNGTVPASQAYLESNAVGETTALAAEFCRHFYTLGWLSGTGGSISIKVHDDLVAKSQQLIVTSPSGVEKEKMVAEDMYVLSSDGTILMTPPRKPYPHRQPRCTDCAPIFKKVYELRDAGAIIHSHGMGACLATMLDPLSMEFRITRMEMIKGIQGHGYHDELVVPIIENTALERELVESVAEVIVAYPKTTAVLVRNHGVYIWGGSWIHAKTQAECYHYLFDAAIKLHQLGLNWYSASQGPISKVDGVLGSAVHLGQNPKARSSGFDHRIASSHRVILLNIEGTTTPLSYFSNVLLPYTLENAEKFLAATYGNKETQDDIKMFCSQIQNDLDQGVLGAVPIPHYARRDVVIASFVANMKSMIMADREITALKQLQSYIWRSAFQSNKLASFVYDDVAQALERWHAAGIKVYIYSSISRETQQLLFAHSNYGDLRKYICGYFDSTVGNKYEEHSYIEILRTVGVDTAADMLFVTDVFQEALAARDAGLDVMLSVRHGNGHLPEDHGFRMIETLLKI